MRIRALLLTVLLAVLASGCATKRDIRDLRGDVQQLESRQDSIFRVLIAQNRAILDSLRSTTQSLLNVRGDLSGDLRELRQQLVQVEELTGQVQIRLTQLDRQLTEAVANLRATGVGAGGGGAAAGGTPGDPDAGADPGGDGFSMAAEFYEIGLEQMRIGNAATARRAFQSVVDSFPAAPVAAQAQFQIGESYATEGSYDEALRAFERVVERYQNSDVAPRALYRAGVIAQERGNNDRARQYFQRVIAGYPNSDARRLAEQALRRL